MRETLPLMTFRLREDAVLGRQRIQHYFQQLLHHQVHSMNILIDATRVSLFYSHNLENCRAKSLKINFHGLYMSTNTHKVFITSSLSIASPAKTLFHPFYTIHFPNFLININTTLKK